MVRLGGSRLRVLNPVVGVLIGVTAAFAVAAVVTLPARADHADAAPASTPSPAPSDSARRALTPLPQQYAKPAPGGLPEVVDHVVTKDPVFFLTIDDGWKRQGAAARWADEHHIPITTFLTTDAAQEHWSYYARISRYDSVQDHTLHHPALGKAGVNLGAEICGAAKLIGQHEEGTPWMLRPPYGDGWYSRKAAGKTIQKAAAACGLRWIVLWNVVVLKDGRVQYVGDLKVHPGDIVLLHFEGDLQANLEAVTKLYARHGLHPAPLGQYLLPPKP